MFPELPFPEGVAVILQPTLISFCLFHLLHREISLRALAGGQGKLRELVNVIEESKNHSRVRLVGFKEPESRVLMGIADDKPAAGSTFLE